MPPAPWRPKALLRPLALATLALVCSGGAAQGLGQPAPGNVLPATSFNRRQPDPKPCRPGLLVRWANFLWTVFLLGSDPLAVACQPMPLPGGPLPAPMPPAQPWPSALPAPSPVALPAFQWPPAQGPEPFDPAGATAALDEALARVLRVPPPMVEATRLLTSLTGASAAPAAPPLEAQGTASPTDLEAATTALVQTASFVQDNLLGAGSTQASGNRTTAQLSAQWAAVQDQLDHALALRTQARPNTSDALSNALWTALAAYSGIASAAGTSPTALNNAALAAGTASEIDETITNFLNLQVIRDFRLPAIRLNLDRFANFSTQEGINPETSGIGPPPIQPDRPECSNCTKSCSFEQNSYQYATAAYGEEATTINFLAYAYFFIKGVELAALDTLILAQTAAPATPPSEPQRQPSSTGGPGPARRLLQVQAADLAHATGPEDWAPQPAAPSLRFPAPLERHRSLRPGDVAPMLPLDTVAVPDVMDRLGIQGDTPYTPECTPCCLLDVNKPLLAAARLGVLTAWLNAVGAGLFGLRADLAIQAYLETLAPPQRPAALADLQANATQSFNAFFEGGTPPPPGSIDPQASSDLEVLQATLAQVSRAVGASGAPPAPEGLGELLAAAMHNRPSARQGTNTTLTDTGWFALQVLTNLATRMPSSVEAKLVSGSLNLAQQWLGNAGYLLRLISNAVGIEANRISTARATKVLVEAAGNKTTSTVNQDASQALCTSSKAVTACNHMNTRIQGGAVKVRFLAAQTGGVAYILALTANFMNLGVDANQILNVVLADPAPPAHPLNGVPLGSAVQAAEAVAGLIGPIQANLAGAMNETQVIALPRAFLSADTPNGLPFEDYGVPVVIEWVKRYVRERNLTDNWLPCCDTANSEAILEADLATLLSSQCLLAGYVLSDVAAGIRIGLQGLADLSLLTAMAKNPARPGPPR